MKSKHRGSEAARAARQFLRELAAIGLAGVTHRLEATLEADDDVAGLLAVEEAVKRAWARAAPDASPPAREWMWSGQRDPSAAARLTFAAFDASGRPLLRRHLILTTEAEAARSA